MIASRIKMKQNFISLINKYNEACDEEHYSYMSRSYSSWYNDCDRLSKNIDRVNNLFKKTFRHLILKDDYKDFSLGKYNTTNPEKMYESWIK